MPFQFICDQEQCLNCGACMDLCPPQVIDMTRPLSGAEGHLDAPGSMPWQMAFPVQVGKCTGCNVCMVECPVNAITILAADVEPPMLPKQGPLYAAPPDAGGWVPLSDLTHETLKRTKPDPWGVLYRWKARVPRRNASTIPAPAKPPVLNVNSGSD